MKKRRQLLIAIVALLLYLVFILWVNGKEQGKFNLYLGEKVASLETEYLVSLNGHQILADFVFKEMVAVPQVLKLMSEASENPSRRDRARAELLTLLSPLYTRLTDLNFRQLHFHLPNSTSFLRFHRPDKYGDSLVGVRDTVVAANTTLQKVSAFEEGRIFNGFRFVYPLFHQDRHVGSVELSVSFTALEKMLTSLFIKHYFFLLDSKIMEETVFTEEQGNYETCILSPRFVHDREVRKRISQGKDTLHTDTSLKLFQEIEKHHQKELDNRQPFARLVLLDKESYLITFLPIKNYRNKNVAYLVSIKKDAYPLQLRRSHHLTLILLSLIFFGGALFTLYLLNTRQRLAALSATDFLTGVLNRGKASEIFTLEHARASRYHTPYAVALIDIDHFKKINDTYGHHAGDLVLKKLAQLISGTARQTDSFCRWGGEEFVLFLPGTSLANALVFAERIRSMVENTEFKQVGRVTISMGISEYQAADNSVAEVIKRADSAMYQAKASGRNRVCQALPPENPPAE